MCAVPECQSNQFDVQAQTFGRVAPEFNGRMATRFRRVTCTPPGNIQVRFDGNYEGKPLRLNPEHESTQVGMSMLLFLAGITFGLSLGLAAPSLLEEWKASRGVVTCKRLSEACLTLRLMEKRKNDVSASFDYASHTGDKLLPMSGCSLINALATYISHGGENPEPSQNT